MLLLSCCILEDLMNRYMFFGLLLITGSLVFWAYEDKEKTEKYNKEPKITQEYREEMFKKKVYDEETKKDTDASITTGFNPLKDESQKDTDKSTTANSNPLKDETEIDPNLTDVDYYNNAIKFQNENNMSEALLNIEKAIKLKKTLKYLQYKAYYLQKSEKYNEVINFIYETIDSSEFENDYYAYYLLGEAQFALKKYTQSKESYKKSIELNNQYQYAYLGLGKSLYHLDSKKKAIEYLLIAKKKNIKGEDVDDYLCKSYKDLNDEDNAIKYCK